MSIAIKVPAVGESITEVTVGQWFKTDGEFVEMDEVLCELESDKATFELTAEAAGVLHTKAEEGETLEIGAVICEIDADAKEGSKPEKPANKKESDAVEKKPDNAEKGAKSKSTGEIKEMHVPTVGESITEVTLASWLKEDGDFVELDDIIAEVDSDKATFELPAEASGILRQVAAEGETLEIGGLICKIEVTDGPPAEETSATSESKSTEESKQESSGKESYATGHASPAAAKILSEKGIDPQSVNGTGKDGRITKEDAEKAEKPSTSSPSKTGAPSKEKTEGTKSTAEARGERPSRREKMSSLRKTISRRLVSVKNETAMLTTFNEVNMK